MLRFNDKHVIDSDSDFVSPDSADSLFSHDSDSLKKTLRERVMIRMLDDDILPENCLVTELDKSLAF